MVKHKSVRTGHRGGSPASKRVMKFANAQGGGSDFLSTLYSRGPVNGADQPDVFAEFSDPSNYISNTELRGAGNASDPSQANIVAQSGGKRKRRSKSKKRKSKKTKKSRKSKRKSRRSKSKSRK